MKATVLLENLKNGLTFAHHAVSSRSQLPVLLNFLIEAKEDGLFISATDLEIGINVKIPAKIDEKGETTVSAKTFLDFVSSIPQEKIELLTRENVLEIRGAGLKTTLPTLSATEFPKLYEDKGTKQALFKKVEFDQEISRIVFSAATDLGRPALSGVLIRKGAKDKGLSLVATDGYRLSLKEGMAVGSANSQEEINLLIPARLIKEISGLKDTEDVTLYVSDKSNQALFESGDTLLVGRLIESEYPEFQKIIPQDHSTKVSFDKTQAQNAVRSCMVFAREAANIIKMSILKDKIFFSASASSAGENEMEIEAKTEGEENEIAFNARYLMDLFSNTPDEQMSFEMTGPLNPGVFKLEKDPSFLHLIMPIRVQG